MSRKSGILKRLGRARRTFWNSGAVRRLRSFTWRHRRPLGIAAAVFALTTSALFGYYYVQFSRLIDERLHGERDRAIPRVFARPLAFKTGQVLGEAELVMRLNDVGYTQRGRVERPGEFAVDGRTVAFIPEGGDAAGKPVVLSFPEPPAPRKGAKQPPPRPTSRIAKLQVAGKPVSAVTLDAPMITALVTGAREKRRRVALESIPSRVKEAVLAIEDRRFYGHPGIDPIRMVGALVTNVAGDRPYLVGASTITQQLARNFFLTEEMALEQQTRQRSLRRKLLEQFMAIVLETRATKDEILELYLNDVYLGHRGSFALHGVAEAARMFFAKDISNVSLGEAALIAGVIQSPYYHSPFSHPDRAKERRDVVLRAMADAGYIAADASTRAMREPMAIATTSIDNEAPWFIDYLGPELDAAFPGAMARPGVLDVHSTLDLNFQRYAQDAVRAGLTQVDTILARRKRGPPRRAQAALVAIDPRSGEILAMVGGRSYNQSQFNRATTARRQPGSTFKPFVYLAAFEAAAEAGLVEPTPATMVWDEPMTLTYDDKEWSPKNYEDEYDGFITLRRALALSRNSATIRVAEQTGFDKVAAFWRRMKIGEGPPPRGVPSIALGVYELTPLELATAYTVFPGGGTIHPLKAIARVISGKESLAPPVTKTAAVARPGTAYLVTHMMRSVLNEGTGAGARAQGFALDAAGKTGTTNDLRDAWFVGFTPELLTVVWVGLDENQPLGLSGTQAALPIWTSFMMKALAGHPNVQFEAPEDVSLVEIDRDTGKLAGPYCPRVTNEVFLIGTEPAETCPLHRW